nr:hypothetical protein Itr_chr09CG09620 [Ipomoea trifida]
MQASNDCSSSRVGSTALAAVYAFFWPIETNVSGIAALELEFVTFSFKLLAGSGTLDGNLSAAELTSPVINPWDSSTGIGEEFTFFPCKGAKQL